jgi:hypothetical protein
MEASPRSTVSLSTSALGLDSRGGCLYASILEIFHEGIRDFRSVVVSDTRGRALHILHQTVEVVVLIGNADDADGSAIPEFRGIELCD